MVESGGLLPGSQGAKPLQRKQKKATGRVNKAMESQFVDAKNEQELSFHKTGKQINRTEIQIQKR